MEIRKWTDVWDGRIENWIKGIDKPDMGLKDVFGAYAGKGKKELQISALPEPYVGNPFGKEIGAVFLMLNPGGAGEEQKFPNGSLVKKVGDSSYSKIAKEYLAEGTKIWWEKRSEWPARLMGVSTENCSVVGIDLIPWHSIAFGRIKFNDSVLKYFKNEVLRPAALIAKESKLSKKFGKTVVLAIGAAHKKLLKEEELGFKLKKEMKGASGDPSWPRNKKNNPTNRNIRLYESKKLGLSVLQTDAPGGFYPPREAFDSFVHKLLSE